MATLAAMASAISPPPDSVWPMAMKAGGRLPMLVASVCADVYQIAAPEKNIIVDSVTMNEGILSAVTETPFSNPMPPPTTMKVRMPTGTAKTVLPR